MPFADAFGRRDWAQRPSWTLAACSSGVFEVLHPPAAWPFALVGMRVSGPAAWMADDAEERASGVHLHLNSLRRGHGHPSRAGRPSTVSGGWASGGGVEMRCQQRGLHGRQKCFSFNMEMDSGHASIGGSTRTQRRQQSQSARQCPNSHFQGWRISTDPILCRLLRCRSSALVSRLLRAIGYCTSNARPITPHCLHNASCSIVPCLA